MPQDKILEVRNEILREVYSKAEPPLDIDKVLENPNEYAGDWYAQHTLPRHKQREIFEEIVAKYDLSERQVSQLSMTTLLNLGPAYADEN